ncbi:MAG TPA: methyltransferase domain-containing protein [Myxococcota bacterium]|jgi:trans-aconitate 2-methyltransferase
MQSAATASHRWDPAQYERFRGERARPFFDLLSRVPDGPVRSAADLGCGTGELTRSLLERWPQATVWGVDHSEEMLARAAEGPAQPRLRFVRADLARWEPEAPVDRIVSNAALQWLPEHGELLERLTRFLAPEGALAVQVPHNRGEGAFRVLDELVLEAPWRERLRAAGRRPSIETPHFYAQRLLGLGLEIELWETTYHHRMAGAPEIVEWMKGTALRPLLAALAPAEQQELLDALVARITPLHPRGPHGIFFPFRRLFFVARKT